MPLATAALCADMFRRGERDQRGHFSRLRRCIQHSAEGGLFENSPLYSYLMLTRYFMRFPSAWRWPVQKYASGSPGFKGYFASDAALALAPPALIWWSRWSGRTGGSLS
ncbi:hypothetical protein KCP74_11840 [Salmonella enterica subsp. enterica]|nr:hypothetical protein KCP74_11840 [Salmonella enterica subsp. enterica]